MTTEKLTAVEWFAKQLYNKFEMKGDGKVFDKLLKQAKEMEKQEKIEFAKLHVSKALNAACNNLDNGYRILTSYPLENIK